MLDKEKPLYYSGSVVVEEGRKRKKKENKGNIKFTGSRADGSPFILNLITR